MNNPIKKILVFFTVILFISCKAQNTKVNAEKQTKTAIEERTQWLDKQEPLKPKDFEKWLPKKVADFALVSHEINKEMAGAPKNNIQLIYKNNAKKIEIIIVDAAKDASALEMIYFAFDMDNQLSKKETKKQESKEPHHISKYNEEKKTAQILSIINKRFGVSAKGENMNPDALWLFVKQLQINKLK